MTQTDLQNLAEETVGYPLDEIEVIELAKEVSDTAAINMAEDVEGSLLRQGVSPKKKWILKRVED